MSKEPKVPKNLNLKIATKQEKWLLDFQKQLQMQKQQLEMQLKANKYVMDNVEKDLKVERGKSRPAEKALNSN